MTDERYVYQQDAKHRKSQAISARKRRGHNGKPGCYLPYETMTRKELMSMNGPVESINLNEPIRDWSTFEKLSSSMQESYLWNLKEKYNPSVKALSQMFNVSEPTIRKFYEHHFPNLKPSTTKSISKEHRNELHEFRIWAGIESEKEEIIAETKEEETMPNTDRIIKYEDARQTKPINGQMEFHLNGKIDVSLITLILEQVINSSSEGEISICYRPY